MNILFQLFIESNCLIIIFDKLIFGSWNNMNDSEVLHTDFLFRYFFACFCYCMFQWDIIWEIWKPLWFLIITSPWRGTFPKLNIFSWLFLKYLRLQLPKQIIKHFSTYCLSASNFVILAPCSISNIPILSTVSWNRPHMGDLFLLCWL